MASTIRRLYGRNCEAGWGYDAENGVFISNPGLTRITDSSNSIFATTKEFNINSCNFFTFGYFPNTSFIESLVGKNKNSYKFMDFISQNWKTNGYISDITSLTNCSYINDPPISYQSKTTHYVKRVYYGLQMFVIFDRKNSQLFKNESDDGEFLNEIWRQQTSLSVEQRNVTCSVLILSPNHVKTIIKEMTILEIVNVLFNFRNDKYFDFIGSVHCHLKPMPNYKVLVISQDEIETVQNQLFQLYQKRKLLDKELDLLDSSSNLKKSSNEVKKMKKRVELFKYEKLWDLKMKQCSKLLQGSKLTDFELNFDSAFNELLEIKCELQTATVAKTIDPELICNSQFDEPFGRKIQSESIAEKIGAQLCSIDQIIIMDKDYFYLLDPEMAKKFKMGVFLSNEDDEPFISNKNLDKKILIGFASHKNRFTSDELETSEMFVTRCPEKCTRDDRQWICITCGNFFKAKNFEVVCDCGTTHVTNLKLECFDPKHPKTILPSSLKSCSTSGISTPRTTSSPTLE